MKEDSSIFEFLEAIITDEDDMTLLTVLLEEDREKALKILLDKIDA